MRVLIASGVADSARTGMGKWAHRVADALCQSGHVATLWFEDDVLVGVRSTAATVMLYPIALASRIVRHRHKFDVVIVHEPGGFWYGVARWLVPSLPPLVAMCHNVESKWFRQRVQLSRQGLAEVSWSSRIKTPLFRLWQSDGTIRLADHVICLSTEDNEYITQVLGRSAESVTRVLNGTSNEDFSEALPAATGNILFIGGWLDVKGARMLPSIFHRIRAALPQTSLTIAGAGISSQAVLDDFPESDRPQVQVIDGSLEAPAVRALYQSHAVFLMPSLSEGSPLALLEAMAAARPIVASDVGGIPDLVRNGVDGLLFTRGAAGEAAEQVCRLLGDSNLASLLGQTGRLRAQGLTWMRTADGIERAAAAALGQRMCPA